MRIYTNKFILLLLIVFFSGCVEKTKNTGKILDYVPENTSMILKISDWATFRNDIKNNRILQDLNNSEISKQEDFIQSFHPGGESLLTFQKLNKKQLAYTLITHQSNSHFQIDSTQNRVAETLKIDNFHLDRIQVDKKIIFTTIVDSIFIASSSQEILLNTLKGKTEETEAFNRIKQLPSTDGLSVYLKGDAMRMPDSSKINLTSWNALDLLIAPEAITAQGISLPGDTIPQLLKIFEKQIPQKNYLAQLAPINAISAFSLTFNDFEKFQQKLGVFRGDKEKIEQTEIFDSSSEIGVIELQESTAVFIKSIDETITSDALIQFVSSENTYRDIEIKKFSEPDLFHKVFYPFIIQEDFYFVFQLDDFFVFTSTEKIAEEIIGAYLNNSTLKNTGYFNEISSDLSSSSSFLYYSLNGKLTPLLSYLGNANLFAGINSTDFSDYPLLALQYSYDRDFAHIALSFKEFGKSGRTISKGISEEFHLQLDNNILAGPWIFEGNTSNFVVQDINNTLHFISENGKKLWTKQLNSPILGSISQVDIFKNGNQQMVFATEESVYILDRNGKDVSPFPIRFRDKITQPLSVFDYDGNHDYRFVVTQGKEVLMYDKKAKTVTGFGFKKTQSDIIQSPVHIRMGNKDYIIIAEQNGKLNILNRMGRTRVEVSDKFDFSEIPITSEGVNFIVITKNNIKKSISNRGVVSSINLDTNNSYWFTTLGSDKATLDDNLLRINGNLADLPIGIYSEPELFKIGHTTYVTITEIQEKKIYLFDEQAKLISGFPVFGSSKASIGTRNTKNTYFVVRGDSNDIIVYKIH